MSDLLQVALINDAVRYLHLLPVAIGLGASFFADYSVLRSLNNPVTKPFLQTLDHCHRLVWGALLVMWVSGVALIYLRTGFVWDNVSPKLIDKVVVVTVLSLNAWAIGKIAMQRVEGWVGQRLLDLPMRAKLPMAVIAGVSTTSWLFALALGSSKVLAQSDAAVLVPLTAGAYGVCGFVSVLAVIALGRMQPATNPQNDAVAATR